MDDQLHILRVDNKQLSYKTKRALLDLIRTSSQDNVPFKLPNEDELSRRLGISRNVLRDALASRSGWIPLRSSSAPWRRPATTPGSSL